MNLLVFLGLLASFSSLSAAETLYHREGRFIDLAVHRYKTQLPSISDIANSFIHYRVPVAVFVPTVRLNIRSKQKRIPYSSFPSTSLPSKKVDQPADVQNKPSTIEQEPMNKSNKEATPSSNVVISRTGWTPAAPSARSLTKPNRSYYSIQNNKLHRINEALRRRNYASSSESNADLVPFLYKDNLQTQPILFNSNYQLSGSNSGQVYAQNIAYIQPNSVSPFQPNFLLVPASQPTVQQLANVSAPVSANSTAVQQSPAGQSSAGQSTAGQPSVASAPVVSSNPTEQPANRPVSESIVTANASDSIAQFDVSQVGENPDEIAPEHVQNHENLDAVPVNSVEDSAKVNLTYSDPSSVDVASISNLSSISNATTSQISSQPTNPLGEENRQPEPIQNARLIEIPAYVYGSNFVRRLESGPVYEPVRVRSPKNLVTSRAHRSLYRSPPIDMPSMVGLYTAAAAQSGHTRENRRDLFARFLDENS